MAKLTLRDIGNKLKEKLQTGFGVNDGKPFIQSPVGQKFANFNRNANQAYTKNILQPIANAPRFEFARKPIENKVLSFGRDIALGIPESFVNIPRNLAVGAARLEIEKNKALMERQRPNLRNIASGIAPIAEAGLDFASFGVGSNIAKQGAKQLIKGGIKQAAKKGAISGGLYGASGGLTYGLDRQYGKDFSGKQLLGDVTTGAALGGVLGGGLAGGGAFFEQVINGVKKLNPKLSQKQAQEIATAYLRDKAGRFAKQAVGYKGVMPDKVPYQPMPLTKVSENKMVPSKYAGLYKNLDKNLNLPENFDIKRIKLGLGVKEITPEGRAKLQSTKGVESGLYNGKVYRHSDSTDIVGKQYFTTDPSLFKAKGKNTIEANITLKKPFKETERGSLLSRQKIEELSKQGYDGWINSTGLVVVPFDKESVVVNKINNIAQPSVTKGVESMPVKTPDLQTTTKLPQPLKEEVLSPSGEIISPTGKLIIEKKNIEQLKAQNTALAEIASSQRDFSPTTIKDINILKRISKGQKFQVGDVETFRSEYPKLTEGVIQSIRENPRYSNLTDGEALQIALEMPTKKQTIPARVDSSRIQALTREEQLQKRAADADYKAWQQSVFKEAGAKRTPYMQQKTDIENVGKSISKNTPVAGVGVEEMKDLSGFKAYTRDIYRNFKEVYGPKYENIKRVLLDPFDKSKGDLSRNYINWGKRINKEVEVGLGIKKGSKESAATQMFGEGKTSYEELVKNFGKNKADNIVKADLWFRKEYDQLLDEVNATMKRVYPNNPEKQIPKRQDYYRHFRDMGQGISGLLNIFDSPSNIASGLAGTSEFTKPKSKWLSFAQKRLGGQTDVDAVGGFIDYVKAAEYNKNIDPHTAKFRALAEDLVAQTENDPKLNGFIEYLGDFAGDLAGKTNPADRFVQKVIPGGRKAMSVLNWLNSRVKANVILGNASSSIAQIFNVPQGIADAGVVNSTKGLGLSIANLFGEATPINKSNFVTERYSGKAFDVFDRGIVNNTKKFAAWMTGALDELGTKYIWNSEYAKAISQGIKDPIKYADDVTRSLVAGRGVGEVPLIQKSKLFQLAAPFQLEVANLWHVMGDWVGQKQFGKLATFFLASYIFNRAAEQIRGSDVSFDPIQASVDAYNAYKEEEDKKIGIMRAGGRIAGEVISNIPLGQSLAAAYPEYGAKVGETQLPTREQFFGEGDPTRFGSGLLVAKGLQDPLYKILPPFGGQQFKRTLEGIKATQKGFSESKTGRVRFPTEQTPLRQVQRAVFGEYSTPNARNYFDSESSVLGEKQSQTFKRLLKTDPTKAQEYYNSIMNTRKNNKKQTLQTNRNSSLEVSAAEDGGSKSSKTLEYIKDGKLLTVDLNKSFEYPTMDPKSAIGKEAISRYKADISAQVNKIYDAYKDGKITEKEASDYINQLSIAYDKTKKPKDAKKPKKITLKVSSYKAPKITIKKRSKTKIPTIKFKKPKKIKIVRKYTIK